MQTAIQWITENAQWFFSGAGVEIISVIFTAVFAALGWLFFKRRGLSQKQRSGSNSQNYQAGGDINIRTSSGAKDD